MTNKTPAASLYLQPGALLRNRRASRDPVVRLASAKVREDAARFVDDPRFAFDLHNGHNAHLIRARLMQTRVVTLLATWLETGDERYRRSVLRHVEEMGTWEHWSWIAWRKGENEPDAIFDLSYGENSATLAVAFDLLRPSLSPAEKKMILELAATRALSSFRRHTTPGQEAGWMNRPDCNWQSVCAGGGGLLALALRDDLPDMAPLIGRADDAVLRYMKKADEYGGGSVEGLAYWNYGMRYAFHYLLSHESATGKPHPALALPGARQTLRFPLDFNPAGVPCGFGDINHGWTPMPFHYAAAARFKDTALLAALDNVLPPEKLVQAGGGWPQAAELLFLRPAPAVRKTAPKTAARGRLQLYPVMDWGLLASSADQPRLAAAVRGGTTEGPHTHQDVLSYHLVFEGEAFVTSVSNRNYVDTTFSDRRYDIWEMRPDAKNTLLIGGVGLSKPAAVTTRAVRVGPTRGFHMCGPDAIRIKYQAAPLVRQLERLFLIWQDRLFVVVDHVKLDAPNQLESRFHTFTQAALTESGGTLTGKKGRLSLAFASTRPFVVKNGQGTPTDPAAPVSSMVRLFSKKLESEATFATVFSAGTGPVGAELSRRGDATRLRLHGRGFDFTLNLPLTQLEPKTP